MSDANCIKPLLCISVAGFHLPHCWFPPTLPFSNPPQHETWWHNWETRCASFFSALCLVHFTSKREVEIKLVHWNNQFFLKLLFNLSQLPVSNASNIQYCKDFSAYTQTPQCNEQGEESRKCPIPSSLENTAKGNKTDTCQDSWNRKHGSSQVQMAYHLINSL